MSGCYRIECAEDNQSYTVYTHDSIEETSFECRSKEDSYLHGPLMITTYCEDPKDICRDLTTCEYDCHHR